MRMMPQSLSSWFLISKATSTVESISIRRPAGRREF
jgi:hypothetical protein